MIDFILQTFVLFPTPSRVAPVKDSIGVDCLLESHVHSSSFPPGLQWHAEYFPPGSNECTEIGLVQMISGPKLSDALKRGSLSPFLDSFQD